MWHEARRQERKIRGLMVDYKKRADRRREYYQKIVSYTEFDDMVLFMTEIILIRPPFYLQKEGWQTKRILSENCKLHWIWWYGLIYDRDYID